MNQKEGAITLTSEQLLKHEWVLLFLEGNDYITKPKPNLNAPYENMYKEFNRGLAFEGKKLGDRYNEKFPVKWKWGNEAYEKGEEKEQTDKADSLIEDLLGGVNNKALRVFKEGYIQDIQSVAMIPFTLLSLASQEDRWVNLFKTENGNIGAHTVTNMQALYDQNDNSIYLVQCQIEMIWEPNKNEQYALKSMIITGPGKDTVAQLFLNPNSSEPESGKVFIKKHQIKDPHDFVEALCKENDPKGALFKASRMNKDGRVYKEMVEPKTTFFDFLHRIGEALGLVDPKPPRPEFTLKEHKILIEQHFDVLLNDKRKDNPYREKLDQLAAEDKLSFLCNYVGRAGAVENLDDNFFNGLDENLTQIINSKDETDKKIRDSIVKALDELVNKDTASFLNTVVAKVPKLFTEYARDCSESKDLFSSTERMLKIEQFCDDKNNRILMKDVPKFFTKLHGNLSKLAKMNLEDLSETEKVAIKNIKSIIQEDKKKFELFQGMFKEDVKTEKPKNAESVVEEVKIASDKTRRDSKNFENIAQALENSAPILSNENKSPKQLESNISSTPPITPRK